MTRGKAGLRAHLAFCSILMLPAVSTHLLGREQKAIQVAAAADLKFAMEELSKGFESKTGTKVDITTGSSGTFFAQIQSGAPFDLFFSADMDYPKKLEAAGLAEPETFREYAVGKIVLWAPSGAVIDVAKDGWNALLDGAVQKIAIANPAHAPYGRAAVAALQKAGIYEQMKTKLIYGENISQAAQFVQSGNAQVGIIALSLAVSSGMRGGKIWQIPAKLYPALEQGAVVLKSSKNRNAAGAFLEFVTSVAGHEILRRNGFGTPPNK